MRTVAQRARRNLRLNKTIPSGRYLTAVEIRIFNTMLEDLKDVAKLLNVDWQGIARSYIAQGLKNDLEAFEDFSAEDKLAFLKKHEVSLEDVKYIMEPVND